MIGQKMGKNPFDIRDCLVAFIDDSSLGKVRPVLIVDWCNYNPELVYFYKITTQYENKPDYIKAKYFPIQNWQAAGLKKPSYVDLVDLEALSVRENVISGSTVRGRLEDNDIRNFIDFANDLVT